MTFRDLWRPARVLFEGEGAGGGGGGDGTGAGGGGAGAGGDGGAGDGGAGSGTGGAKWWEASDFTAEERQWVEARGLAEEDVAKIVPKLVKGHRNAEIRLGRGVDQILDKPKEGQSVTDWMREQGEIFGLPKTVEEMKLDRPKELPADIRWDDGFAAKARQAAFDMGLNGKQVEGMTGLLAELVKSSDDFARAQVAEANTRMMADLTKDWGAETGAKIARARQAAQVLAQDAGLDAAGIEAVAQVINEKTGDAATMRLFDRIADMLAEDKLIGGGAGQIGMTPAEARAKAAAMRAPGGAYFEASKAGDTRKLAELAPEIQRLDRIAAGGRA